MARSRNGSPVIAGARIPVRACVLETVSAIPKTTMLVARVTAALRLLECRHLYSGTQCGLSDSLGDRGHACLEPAMGRGFGKPPDDVGESERADRDGAGDRGDVPLRSGWALLRLTYPCVTRS
jgi:hypothetical protein